MRNEEQGALNCCAHEGARDGCWPAVEQWNDGLIFSKAARKSASEKPKRAHEVLDGYKRLPRGPRDRRKAQRQRAGNFEILLVGSVFFRRRVLGNCDQMRARGSESSEAAFGIHSSCA